MNRSALALFLLIPLLCCSIEAQDAKWKRTDSDGPYLHRIHLRDATGLTIDPLDADASSPDLARSCAPCHDVEAASGGLHGKQGPDGRPGEPWFLVDPRSATRLPVHHRSWPGHLHPDSLEMDATNWSRSFGRHDPALGTASDCLVYHLAEGYSFSKRIEKIDSGDVTLAPFYAAGILDPAGKYDPREFDSNGQVEWQLLSDAGNEACFRCHTVRDLDSDGGRGWLHEQDVHLAAGLTCVDCHRSGIDHNMVRGFEDEVHPSGRDVSALSCRGCHLDPDGGGMGAPIAQHRGLPPFHLDEIHCTACHSGPLPTETPIQQWTSRAHRLGEPSQLRLPDTPPRIIATTLLRDEAGVIGPVRISWPDGWGILDAAGEITFLSPADLRRPLRRALRVRADLVAEVSDELSGDSASGLLDTALQQLQSPLADGQTAVLISGGQAHRSSGDGKLESFSSTAANPVHWAISHPVRPARTAVGAQGCTDCHSKASRWIDSAIGATTLLPIDSDVVARSPLDQGIVDRIPWQRWALLFTGRDLGKIYFTICASLAIIGGILSLWKSIDRESS